MIAFIGKSTAEDVDMLVVAGLDLHTDYTAVDGCDM